MLNTYFLTIIAGIDNTERVASDFSNALGLGHYHLTLKTKILMNLVILKFSYLKPFVQKNEAYFMGNKTVELCNNGYQRTNKSYPL